MPYSEEPAMQLTNAQLTQIVLKLSAEVDSLKKDKAQYERVTYGAPHGALFFVPVCHPFIDRLPAMQVTADSVPTVVAYGTKDKIVPVNLKYDLLDALDANDVDYTYIEFTNSGHAMAFDPYKTQEYLDTVADYMEKYFGGTEQ